MSQIELSIILGRGPKFIFRIENGYGEADLLEFMDTLGIDAAKALHEIVSTHR